MPRIYTSANDPLGFCCHCFPKPKLANWTIKELQKATGYDEE